MSESAIFIRHYITIYLLILAVERLYRILRSSLCGKRKGEQKESFTGGRIIRPDGYFVGGHFFTAKDACSVWTFVVCLVMRLEYKEGHKTHYASRRTILRTSF